MTHPATSRPNLAELVRVSAMIGCLSFGGPAGQIALMHTELVEKRRWIDEEAFLHALNFCNLLPGPEAQQLATYIGWRLHGWRGGLVSGLLFVVPGALVILALSILYAFAAQIGWFAALFVGIKAAVLAIVAQALVRLAGRALTTGFKRAIAIAAFVALALLQLPFPAVVLTAGALGIVVAGTRPEWLGQVASQPRTLPDRPRLVTTARTLAIGAVLWAAPMAAVLAMLGPDHVLWQVGVFFSKLAVVTFGGAYAVLAYMAQEGVQTYHWLQPGEMADGLGLAETTPGPLILVTQFVGFFAGFRAPAPFEPLVAGVAAAALTTWVTFVPCFIWIFAFAPWIDRLRDATRLSGGMAAITAAVVSVIASLGLWFAIHVLFARVIAVPVGWGRIDLPDLATLDWRVAAIAIMAAILLLRYSIAVWKVLLLAALAGLGTMLA